MADFGNLESPERDALDSRRFRLAKGQLETALPGCATFQNRLPFFCR